MFRQRPSVSSTAHESYLRRLGPRLALWLGLLCILVLQGAAITESYLWAAPLICLLVIAFATSIPLVPFVGIVLFVRVLTDEQASATSRHSEALSSSRDVALIFILVAVGLLLSRRQYIKPTVLAILWLCVWTLVAVALHGVSVDNAREGIREISLVALAVIVCNANGAITVPIAVRLVQVAGILSALLALYQLATHTGILISGHIRSNGTFIHPNTAAIYFAIATTASLWRYLDYGKSRSDIFFITIYGAAMVATLSLDGLASLVIMLMTYGALRPGSFRVKLNAFAAVVFLMTAFLATPVGSERIANESSTQISTSQRHGTENTSLAWRLYKWGTLLPEWEKEPFFGQGIGTTVAAEATSESATAAKVPHNEYVRYLVETGIVGLLILLWATTLLIRHLSLQRRTPGTGDIGALGIAIVVGCLVDSVADNTLLSSTTGYAAVLIVTAILVSPAKITQKSPALITS